MSFARIRAPGLWTLGSVIAPTEMEQFDQDQFEAVDGYGGGAYAPTSRLVLGGAGADFTGGTGADPLGPLTSTAALGTNASGLVATGDGTGAGATLLGGATNGNGLRSTGVGFGVGVFGIGGLNAPGGAFVAVGGDQPGLTGHGHGTGSGGTFTGGNSAGGVGLIAIGGGGDSAGAIITGTGSGSGLQVTGGVTDGFGVQATAQGAGSGVTGQGGATAGTGLVGTGGIGGIGVFGQGDGAARGVYGIGGATGGPGVEGLGGANGAGGKFTPGTGSNIGVHVPNSSILIVANAPGGDPGGVNRQWASNIPKAWARVSVAAGIATVLANHNLNVVVFGVELACSFAAGSHMASVDYAVTGVWRNPGATAWGFGVPANEAPGGFNFVAAQGFDNGGGHVYDLSTSAALVNIFVFAVQ